MKKYTLTALILTLIAGVCAALIASINLLTAPIINDNTEKKKAQLCQQIFEEYNQEKSLIETEDFVSDYVKERILAYDEDGDFIGYIYTVKGSNTFGDIELLVGITSDLKLSGARFITNGQSFSNEANKHLTTQYKENMTLNEVLGLNLQDSDVTAGATYASRLIRSLVEAAFMDATSIGGAK